MKFKIWLLLISIPLVVEISMAWIGLIGIMLTNVVYFPISWLGEPFFVCNSEIGCLPREYGRFLMFLLINISYFLYAKIRGLQ